MDKTGEIKEGVTPREATRPGEKSADKQALESHPTNRLADAAAEARKKQAEARR